MGLAAMAAGKKPPTPTTGAPPPLHPAPTPEGMALWNKLQKKTAKKRIASGNRVKRITRRGPVPTPNDPAGTGGPNDPAWKALADLYKNGLPG